MPLLYTELASVISVIESEVTSIVSKIGATIGAESEATCFVVPFISAIRLRSATEDSQLNSQVFACAFE